MLNAVVVPNVVVVLYVVVVDLDVPSDVLNVVVNAVVVDLEVAKPVS